MPRRAGSARAQILEATVLVIYERGYGHTTVTELCARCRVARGTFYEAFPDLRECFLALMDDAYERVRPLVTRAFDAHEHWQDGLRAALLSLLQFFDAHPKLARVWVVETLGAGTWALERRERHLAALTQMIVGRWTTPGHEPSAVAAASVMESVVGMIRTHLLVDAERPILELLGPMMALIVRIYLGPREASIEAGRCQALTGQILARALPVAPADAAVAPVEVPETLLNPMAHRARDCVRYLAEHPGASNRQIAAAAGISRDDQISTTLARLARVGLLEKRRASPGGPNAWALSPYGLSVARTLQETQDVNTHL